MRWFVGAIFTVIVFVCSAAEIGGVKVDDKVSLGGQELVLNGGGVRTRAIFKVYVGALYLPQKQSSADGVLNKNTPRRISLVMLRDVGAEQMLEAFQAGINDNNSPAEIAAVKVQIAQLADILKNQQELKSGQVLNFDYAPDTGTRVTINGETKGTIAGEVFNQALLKAWLGDKPVQESLKKAMLGGG